MLQLPLERVALFMYGLPVLVRFADSSGTGFWHREQRMRPDALDAR